MPAMPRVDSRQPTPARTPAFLFVLLLLGALLLQGCSLLPGRHKDDKAGADDAPSALTSNSNSTDTAGGRHGFNVRVQGPDEARELLEQHLELQRYRRLDDLQLPEISRLMVAADANARELLGTLGYFTPTLKMELVDLPADAAVPYEVRIQVDPGPRTKVTAAQVEFAGPIATDDKAAAQLKVIRDGWSLSPGQDFTQSAWDGAKNTGLRKLVAQRFPTGSISLSRADIDADAGTARLSVTYQSGPAYRFGPLEVRGAQRYSVDGARRIARVPSGQPYDQQELLDAQARMASSGYYDSVFLTLDTEGDPQAATVVAQVREAKLQKIVLGAGFTSDSGPRLSADHIHNQMPLLGWRAVTKLSVDRNTRSLNSEWSAIPGDDGWRWITSGELKQDLSGDYEVDSGRARFGRSKSDPKIDRAYYLQYDYALNRGVGAPPSASAVSANWSWTGRYFDDAGAPRRGWGLGLELGAGYTLSGAQRPFTRADVRSLYILPLGSVAEGDAPGLARQSRLALRAQLGAVTATQDAQIPSTLLFLTGGDTSVRGYAYRSIGTTNASGATVAGRYLAVLSAEWQKPLVFDNKVSAWESVVFVDAGSVADQVSQLNKPQVGVGVGARWRSPVGPVQADLGYGVETRKLRLHLRLGFSF
ncbi:BamA/TamA family outer membrane protein [Pseudacidovorax sp. RU35E]|uniref:autotransporter assembly complex protein TamA n=1 Tax=Pseudacidovorax sp. RU35E TaxID=1907403 RepID=UPI0009FAE4C0